MQGPSGTSRNEENREFEEEEYELLYDVSVSYPPCSKLPQPNSNFAYTNEANFVKMRRWVKNMGHPMHRAD